MAAVREKWVKEMYHMNVMSATSYFRMQMSSYKLSDKIHKTPSEKNSTVTAG